MLWRSSSNGCPITQIDTKLVKHVPVCSKFLKYLIKLKMQVDGAHRQDMPAHSRSLPYVKLHTQPAGAPTYNTCPFQKKMAQ